MCGSMSRGRNQLSNRRTLPSQIALTEQMEPLHKDVFSSGRPKGREHTFSLLEYRSRLGPGQRNREPLMSATSARTVYLQGSRKG